MRRDNQEMDERVKTVSFQSRDTRMVGCTGDAQIVISNVELEKLIIRVFKAIDSPVDVRSLRSFVMSPLPIMDILSRSGRVCNVVTTADDDPDLITNLQIRAQTRKKMFAARGGNSEQPVLSKIF